MDKPKIKCVHGGEGMLDEIKPLWEALNEHHCQRSTYFKQHYRGMTFEKRKADLLKKAAGGELRVDLAIEEASGQNVGYCVSSLNTEKTGEIESILVDAAYRGLGIGDALIKNALAWMEQKDAVAKIVEVGTGNEQAFGFYARYGFLPRKTVLKQVRQG